jgi:hypothetical protein
MIESSTRGVRKIPTIVVPYRATLADYRALLRSMGNHSADDMISETTSAK